MPLGSVIVPGLRDGGMPWEMVTHGLGTSDVTPGGRFKKNNPGCDCCEECTCESANLYLNMFGFEDGAFELDCTRINRNRKLFHTEAPQFPTPPGSCALALQPDCWYADETTDGPTIGGVETTWRWEVGLNGANRATHGWVIVVHFFHPSSGVGLWWRGSLPGGYIPYDGPIEGLNFTLTQIDECLDEGYPCPHISYEIRGLIGCRCGHSRTGEYKVTFQGVVETGDDCDPSCCNDINREFLYSTSFEIHHDLFCFADQLQLDVEFRCESPSFAIPCSTRDDLPTIAIQSIDLGYAPTANGFDIYLRVLGDGFSWTWKKINAIPTIPFPSTLVFGPSEMCYEDLAHHCLCSAVNAFVTVEAF